MLPRELVPVFRQAKRLADRHAPALEQRALASLIDSGAYERHVRRMRRENERRRTALLDAVARYLPGDAEVAGTAAGLHVVLWLPFLRPQDEPAVAAARGERCHEINSLMQVCFGERLRPRDALIAAALAPSLAVTLDRARWLIRSWRATKRPGAASVASPT